MIINFDNIGGGGGGGSYTLPVATASRLGGIKVGSGLTIDNTGILSVSGGTSSNTKVVMLNKLSQQERLDLYNELSALYDYDAGGWSSAYTEDMYAFYLDLRSYADQDSAQVQDRFEGFYPMLCVLMHPTDYGGAAFFTGVEQDRQGNGTLICIRYVIDYEGNVDGPSTWWNNAADVSTHCIYIGPNGDFWGHRDAGVLFEESEQWRLAVKGCEGDFSAEYGYGSIVYARKVSQNDVWKYSWSLIVPTDTGVMKGVWHKDGDLSDTTLYTLDSWTAL